MKIPLFLGQKKKKKKKKKKKEKGKKDLTAWSYICYFLTTYWTRELIQKKKSKYNVR